MRRFAFTFLLSLVALLGAAQSISNDTHRIREEFQDRRFGIFLHWGIYSMMADGEWIMHNRHIDRDEYAKLAALHDAGQYPAQMF